MNSFVTRPKPPGAMWPYKGPLKGYMVKHLNDLRGSQDLRDLLEKFYTYWMADDELKNVRLFQMVLLMVLLSNFQRNVMKKR